MEPLLAYCGLSCETCPIYLATLETDQAIQEKLRELIAEDCRTIYGMNIQAGDITDCDGCREDTGRLFTGCLNCEIRKCARMKSLESCAFCGEFACDRLLKHFANDPNARLRLEEIRQGKPN